MFKLGVLILALLSSSSVFASDTTGKVKTILMGPTYGKLVFVKVDGVGVHGCNTNTGLNYVFDATTDTGKATLSAVLAIYATGKIASFRGPETCNNYTGVEDLGSITLSN